VAAGESPLRGHNLMRGGVSTFLDSLPHTKHGMSNVSVDTKRSVICSSSHLKSNNKATSLHSLAAAFQQCLFDSLSSGC